MEMRCVRIVCDSHALRVLLEDSAGDDDADADCSDDEDLSEL